MRGVKKLSPDTESHIVSAYDPHLQLVLSMDAVPVKRNELDAIRRLLDELDVTDVLITIDAIGCQHDVAEQVLEAGGDYVFQVKGHQPTLLQELEDSFPNISKGYTVNKEEGLEHGRIEHRQMKSVVLSPEMLDDSYAFERLGRDQEYSSDHVQTLRQAPGKRDYRDVLLHQLYRGQQAYFPRHPRPLGNRESASLHA